MGILIYEKRTGSSVFAHLGKFGISSKLSHVKLRITSELVFARLFFILLSLCALWGVYDLVYSGVVCEKKSINVESSPVLFWSIISFISLGPLLILYSSIFIFTSFSIFGPKHPPDDQMEDDDKKPPEIYLWLQTAIFFVLAHATMEFFEFYCG